MSDPKETQSPALAQSIGGWQIMFYGLGSMLGAGIYALIGKAAGGLGNAVWLAFLMAMIGAMLTGLSYACVGGRYAKAGGAAYVTHRGLGRPLLSYVIGIAVMMSGLTSMATGSQAIIDQIQKLMAWNLDENTMKLCSIGVVFLVGCVIYRGIRESMWLNILCTVIEASGLLFIIAVGVKYWGSVNYLESPGDTAAGGAGSGITLMLVMQGAVLTFYSFIGFEDILNVSEEVKDPAKNVPFGLIGAMVLATCIYMAVAITAVSVVPWQELAKSGTPLMDVASRAAPWFKGIGPVYAAITIFAIGNTALLNYLMGSRLLYGMSHQGLLPSILQKVHPVRKSPHIAVFVLFIIVSILILSGGVKALAESTVLLLLTVFTTVNISLVVLKRRPDEPRSGFEPPVVVPILGALVCASLIIVRLQTAITSGDEAQRTAPLIAGAIVVISLVLYKVLKPRNVVAKIED
ncbi:APC family permease [Brevifollis gellanilyticus]|uniref:Amino acid permease n=1 Tax=Brevifollis gellanilyticus TaxID=748831 RepID=A0A512M1Z3_9BACT|nr:APC family permease [Brevifollis gellanilyticus]GEP40752.1 amino acid permease [Brevifollis gellanilyticus]